MRRMRVVCYSQHMVFFFKNLNRANFIRVLLQYSRQSSFHLDRIKLSLCGSLGFIKKVTNLMEFFKERVGTGARNSAQNARENQNKS